MNGGNRMRRKMILATLMTTLLAGNGAVGASEKVHPEPRGTAVPRHCPDVEGEKLSLAPPDALLDLMSCRLSLSADQQTEIGALLWQEWEQNMPRWKKVGEALRRLRAVETSSTFDESAFRTLSAGQAAAQVELSVSSARLRSRIRALLTPEQRLGLDKLPPLFPPPGHPFRHPGRDRGGAGQLPPPCEDRRPPPSGSESDREP